MEIVAGIDIGNATTEVALAKIQNNKIEFLSSSIVPTTGIKGTKQNINGVFNSLRKALDKANLALSDLDRIRVNEAAPVIGDVAMETITETIITESTMIGHNPNTPGGQGVGVGVTALITDLEKVKEKEVIVVVPEHVNFEFAAKLINHYNSIFNINGAIVKNDDGVLINNRLDHKIPIVDEVTLIDKVPIGMLAAIEVAPIGKVIEVLSNPYGIATLFNLTSDETKHIVPIARALIGNRSAVVIKTPKGDVKERRIPAGELEVIGQTKKSRVNVDSGAQEIMKCINNVSPINDIKGESGTNAGGMLERVRQVMSNLTNQHPNLIKIQDLLAVDTFVPQHIKGGLAKEFALENAVGIAAMVKADKLQMQMIADELSQKLKIPVEVGGVEADMAIRGALTTPGSSKPLAILDMGAGSTDASIITREGHIKSIHLAGAGNMVTMLIKSELGIDDFELAEDIKKAQDTADEAKEAITTTNNKVADIQTGIDGIKANLSEVTTDLHGLTNNSLIYNARYHDNGDGTTTLTAVVYKDGREVTKEYPSTWYSWTGKTESGETFLGYGYTITVNNENYIFGGVVVGRFETYKQQLLTVSIGALTLSGKALCFSTDA